MGAGSSHLAPRSAAYQASSLGLNTTQVQTNGYVVAKSTVTLILLTLFIIKIVSMGNLGCPNLAQVSNQ